MQWHERIGRRLKLRDLHILLAVMQHGSMAKAAAALAISQPAVSKAIADMEQTVGLRLLDRSRHGIEATRYGRALVKHATAIFDELKQAAQELDFLSDPTVGELRIGSQESMAAGVLPAIIDRFSTISTRQSDCCPGGLRDCALSRVARPQHRLAVGQSVPAVR